VSRRGGAAFAGWALFTFALPLLLGYLAVSGLPEIGSRFWPVWAVNVPINLAALYLFFSALGRGDLGGTYPLLALTPLFVVPVEWIALGDLPGRWGLVGIVLIVLGVYLLNFRELSSGLAGPFRALAREPGAIRMLAVALLWSIGGTLDRVAVLESSPAFYACMFSGALCLAFLGVIRQKEGSHGVARWQGLRDGLRAVGPRDLAVHGALFACMVTLQMEALMLAQASYVLSIKRLGSILAVLLGYLAFREGQLVPRLSGALITVVGAGVLVLWG
jgi:drug/metabolite transporter (DMT)-like permease